MKSTKRKYPDVETCGKKLRSFIRPDQNLLERPPQAYGIGQGLTRLTHIHEGTFRFAPAQVTRLSSLEATLTRSGENIDHGSTRDFKAGIGWSVANILRSNVPVAQRRTMAEFIAAPDSSSPRRYPDRKTQASGCSSNFDQRRGGCYVLTIWRHGRTTITSARHRAQGLAPITVSVDCRGAFLDLRTSICAPALHLVTPASTQQCWWRSEA